MLTQAMVDLMTAYNDAAGRTVNPIGVAGNLGGRTLPPGLYISTSSLEISSGDLTLDAREPLWLMNQLRLLQAHL